MPEAFDALAGCHSPLGNNKLAAVEVCDRIRVRVAAVSREVLDTLAAGFLL